MPELKRKTGHETGRSGRDLHQAIRVAQSARAGAPGWRSPPDSGDGSEVGHPYAAREKAFRISLLVESLGSVFDDLPAPRGDFVLTVPPSDPVRYVIDSRSGVEIGDDLRTYRIIGSGYAGREVIFESDDVEAVADAVTRLVAERIVERAGPEAAEYCQPDGRRSAQAPAPVEPHTGSPAGAGSGGSPVSPADARAQAMQGVFWAGAGFGLGVLAGIFLLLVYAWVAVG